MQIDIIRTTERRPRYVGTFRAADGRVAYLAGHVGTTPQICWAATTVHALVHGTRHATKSNCLAAWTAATGERCVEAGQDGGEG